MRISFLFFFLIALATSYGQVQSKVDFTSANATVEPLPLSKSLKGYVQYKFNVLADVDSIFLDARNMKFYDILLNNNAVDYGNNGKRLVIRRKFSKGDQWPYKSKILLFRSRAGARRRKKEMI